MKNRSLFLRSLEAGKSKIKALLDSVSGENPLPGSEIGFSLCPHIAGGRVFCYFYKALIPIMGGPSS